MWQIDGYFAAVGARLDDAGGLSNSGSVELFKLHGNGDWAWHQTLVSPVPSAQYHFGHSVSISGDLLVVGEEKSNISDLRAGAVHVFSKDMSDVWAATDTDNGLAARDLMGRSVAIVGTTDVAGALNADDSGGPRSLDKSWTIISDFLHDERSSMERNSEKKKTESFPRV